MYCSVVGREARMSAMGRQSPEAGSQETFGSRYGPRRWASVEGTVRLVTHGSEYLQDPRGMTFCSELSS